MMIATQIINLQNGFTALKEVVNSSNLSEYEKARIQDAMRDIQATLQVQGVFIS